MNKLIYGKNDLERIVCIEPGDSTAEIFREMEDGSVKSELVPMSHYILYSRQHNPKLRKLAGDQPHSWIYETDSKAKHSEILTASYKNGFDLHNVRDPKEALMIKDGYTYFKGMKTEDVSVLSFDIETTGTTHDRNSAVLIISNTFRRKGKVEKKLFCLDEYGTQSEMLVNWVLWVQKVNPSIIVGHNIFGFDLPYLQFCAYRSGVKLELGRDLSELQFAKKTSQFRKDGSQSYDYHNALIYGREIVDTYFLSIKYDIGRNYESYGLKAIIKAEGLEREGRQHYEAANIGKDWANLEKRKLIKAYAEDDADDALKLYDLMIPSFFYYTQSVPRSFQAIINSATGSQLNSLMVRSYLQDGHSIARGSNAVDYEGAISMGVPGIHKNVFKIDVVSMYPSIIRSFKIYYPDKDPRKNFLHLVEYFMDAKNAHKKKAKETGDLHWKAREGSAKIVVNSLYGMLGAPKLNYNFPAGAAEVTKRGREIFQSAFKWATGREYVKAA